MTIDKIDEFVNDRNLAKEIYKLHLEDKVKMLETMQLMPINDKANFLNTALDLKIEELQQELKSLEGE